MRFVVIGACASGMSFASRIRRNDKNAEIIVLEKNNYVSFGACALPYFLSDSFEDENEFFARTPEQIIESNIDLRIGAEALGVNFNEKLVTYKQNEKIFDINYDKLIITTGATPIVPAFVCGERENIHCLTTFADGVSAKKKLANKEIKKIGIIGSGFIGLEIMDNLHKLGKEVVVFEKATSILANQYSSEMSEIVQKEIVEKGIDLRLNCGVSRVEGVGDKVEVEAEGKTESFDMVFVALGFRPNTNIFENIEKLQNGAIIVNKDGLTSVEDVYSVGDCATVKNQITMEDEYIPLATVANKFGKALADVVVGLENPFDGVIGSSCIKVLDYEMGRTGLTLEKALKYFPNATEKMIKDKNKPHYISGQEDIYIKLVYDKETYKIYGGEIVGKVDAVMRTNVIATFITLGGTTKQLGYTDFCYAPPFARTWDALNLIGNVIK